jgi:hypothetical protein
MTNDLWFREYGCHKTMDLIRFFKGWEITPVFKQVVPWLWSLKQN